MKALDKNKVKINDCDIYTIESKFSLLCNYKKSTFIGLYIYIYIYFKKSKLYALSLLLFCTKILLI